MAAFVTDPERLSRRFTSISQSAHLSKIGSMKQQSNSQNTHVKPKQAALVSQQHAMQSVNQRATNLLVKRTRKLASYAAGFILYITHIDRYRYKRWLSIFGTVQP